MNPECTYSPEELCKIIHDAAKANIPRTSSKPGSKALHWWNEDTKAAVKARRKALRKLKRTPITHPEWKDIHEHYQRLRNQCKDVIRSAKSKFWETFLEGFDSSQSTTEMWRRVNALSGKRRAQGIGIRQKDVVSRDPSFVSNALGQYFSELSSNAAYDQNFLLAQAKAHCTPTSLEVPDDVNDCDFNKPFTITELMYAMDSTQGKEDCRTR